MISFKTLKILWIMTVNCLLCLRNTLEYRQFYYLKPIFRKIMKKILLTCVVALSLLSSAFVEANVKVGVAIDMDLSIVAQIDRYNLVLGDSGFAVDYTIKTGKFDDSTPLTWYLAGGGWAGWDHGYGVRAPIGVNWVFSKGWDLYGQVQPVANFDDKFKFSVDGAIGVRYAF
jgi:hypothetical protein